VWSRERPLGLGAQRFVALIARDPSRAESTCSEGPPPG